MLIGYARVSTLEQETNLQIDALHRAGVAKIFEEKASSIGRRPVLQTCLASLSPGDVLVVYKIDRFARSLFDLLAILDRIAQSGASIRSLCEPFDTISPMGIFMIQILGAVAQLERSMIRERSIAGLVAAIERGVVIGRPRRLTPEQDRQVYELFKTGRFKKATLSRKFNAHSTTIDAAIERFEPRTDRPKRLIKPVLGPYLARVK